MALEVALTVQAELEARADQADQLRRSQVLALMAEGRSNVGIARRLWVTGGTVEKHIRSILSKLALEDTDDDHRRVLAVLAYLDRLWGADIQVHHAATA